MTLSRSELLERIKSYEWSDLEVKTARRDVPDDAYKTVSAFANTAGGYLILGVEQKGTAFEICGIQEFDKVQNDFLSALRSPDKISYQLNTREDVIDTEQGRILVVHIPEAPNRYKPVHLRGDIRRSYIRRGGCDQKCNEDDIRRFLRLAAPQTYEAEPVDIDLSVAIDEATLARYRRRYQEREPEAACNAFDTPRFLEHWALAVAKDGVLRPTRAAILLFGNGAALRRIMPRPIVDCRWVSYDWDDPQPTKRWEDRLLCEDNLWTCWEQLAERYARNAAKPFALDIATMERQDRPENFVSFREAAINLLMHQDFEELTRSATISFHPDRVVFENPGTSLVGKAALLEPGAKPMRNPAIVATFRRAGLSEQAGTGISAIFGDWRRRGRIPPKIVNDVANYTFRLSLLAKELLSDRQLLFQGALGVQLSDGAANALAILCGQSQVTLPEFRAALGLGSMDVMTILQRLQTQVLAERITLAEGECYQLAPHLRERWPLPSDGPDNPQDSVTDQARTNSGNLDTDQARAVPDNLVTDRVHPGASHLVTDQPRRPRAHRLLTDLTDQQRQLIAACDTPRTMTELMALLGISHRAHFRTYHLQPLLDGGLLRLQFPDVPNHPRQRYVLTPVGARIVGRQIADEGDNG